MDDVTKKRIDFLVKMGYYGMILFLVYLCLKYLLWMIFPFVLAFIIASALNPLIRKINEKLPNSRSAISFVLMFLVYVVIASLLFSAVVTFVVWIKDVAINFSDTYYGDVLKPNLTNLWENISSFLAQLPGEWQAQVDVVQGNVMSSVQNFVVSFSQRLLGWVSSFGSRIPGFIIAFVFTIMLSFFVSMQYDKVTEFIQRQLPDWALEIIGSLRKIFGKTVFSYLRALLTLMGITAVELSIGLLVLGVEHAILIAIGIAIFDALPVFGTGAIMIPWIAMKLIQGDYRLAVGLLILYGVVTLARNILEPKIVGDKLGINPIVSIIAIYIGFKALGVIGMILMPIVVQILLELHKEGIITLYKRPKEEEEPEPLPESTSSNG